MKGHENKKKYPNHRSWGKNGKREKKMHAMRGSKDLYRYDNVTNAQFAFAPSEGYESVPFNVWEQRPE